MLKNPLIDQLCLFCRLLRPGLDAVQRLDEPFVDPACCASGWRCGYATRARDGERGQQLGRFGEKI